MRGGEGGYQKIAGPAYGFTSPLPSSVSVSRPPIRSLSWLGCTVAPAWIQIMAPRDRLGISVSSTTFFFSATVRIESCRGGGGKKKSWGVVCESGMMAGDDTQVLKKKNNRVEKHQSCMRRGIYRARLIISVAGARATKGYLSFKLPRRLGNKGVKRCSDCRDWIIQASAFNDFS